MSRSHPRYGLTSCMLLAALLAPGMTMSQTPEVEPEGVEPEGQFRPGPQDLGLLELELEHDGERGDQWHALDRDQNAVNFGDIVSDVAQTSGWFFPAGLDIGVGLTGPAPVGLLLGAEASAVYIRRMTLWAGGLVAGRYDFGTEHAYGTLAVEAGYRVVGLEAGLDVRDDGALGGRFRLYLGAAAGYYVGIDTVGGARLQLGILLKYPFGA